MIMMGWEYSWGKCIQNFGGKMDTTKTKKDMGV